MASRVKNLLTAMVCCFVLAGQCWSPNGVKGFNVHGRSYCNHHTGYLTATVLKTWGLEKEGTLHCIRLYTCTSETTGTMLHARNPLRQLSPGHEESVVAHAMPSGSSRQLRWLKPATMTAPAACARTEQAVHAHMCATTVLRPSSRHLMYALGFGQAPVRI